MLQVAKDFVGLNIQPDHMHLIVMIPPKFAMSTFMGRFKEQDSMRIFRQFRHQESGFTGVNISEQKDIASIRLV